MIANFKKFIENRTNDLLGKISSDGLDSLTDNERKDLIDISNGDYRKEDVIKQINTQVLDNLIQVNNIPIDETNSKLIIAVEMDYADVMHLDSDGEVLNDETMSLYDFSIETLEMILNDLNK